MEEPFVWIVGVLAVPAIGWIKNQLNVQGPLAFIVSAIVIAVLAFGYLFLNGELNLADFTLANFDGVFLLVFATATALFKLLPANLKDRV